VPTRREFLRAGTAGAVLLTLLRRLPVHAAAPPGVLEADQRQALAAIIPVMLAGALPEGEARAQAVSDVANGVEVAVAGLPPHLQDEVAELFTLLTFAPTRCLVAGVWRPWPQAHPDDIGAFLQDWRTSWFSLLQSAYHALHELIMASWYARSESWAALAYPGPPRLA
jgi:hypothetical protein